MARVDVIKASDLKSGDIFDYSTPGAAAPRRALVYSVQRLGNAVTSLMVLPITEYADRKQNIPNDSNNYMIPRRELPALNLPESANHRICFEPKEIPLRAFPNNGTVKRLSEASETPFVIHAFQRMEEVLDKNAGRYASSNLGERLENNQVFIKDRLDDPMPEGHTIVRTRKNKSPRRRNTSEHTSEGEVSDISIDDALKAGLIDTSVHAALTSKPDGRWKEFNRLSEAITVAKDEDKIRKLAQAIATPAASNTPSGDISLKEALEQEYLLEPLTVTSLYEYGPKPAGLEKGLKKVETLREAYELVTQRPDDLKLYEFVGAVVAERIKEDVTEGWAAWSNDQPEEKTVADVETAIELVRKSLNHARRALAQDCYDLKNLDGRQNLGDEDKKRLSAIKERYQDIRIMYPSPKL